MAKSLQEARGSLISDIETLNNLLSSLGETQGRTGCRDPGRSRMQGPREKGQTVKVQGCPACWCWVSCLLATQAELDALQLRLLRVLAKFLECSCLEESPCAE